jgi:hypothetical protein
MVIGATGTVSDHTRVAPGVGNNGAECHRGSVDGTGRARLIRWLALSPFGPGKEHAVPE